nr:PREDICTED: UDP-glucuronosyltransferase 1-1-like [Balearica regulorum gibbericeps]
MTFTQRVKNMLVRMLEFVYCKPIFTQFEELAYVFLQKKVTATDLLSRGSVWLMRYDFVFEFPTPVMPNMVFIGGINCDQKKKLPQLVMYVRMKEKEQQLLTRGLSKGHGVKSGKDF